MQAQVSSIGEVFDERRYDLIWPSWMVLTSLEWHVSGYRQAVHVPSFAMIVVQCTVI